MIGKYGDADATIFYMPISDVGEGELSKKLRQSWYECWHIEFTKAGYAWMPESALQGMEAHARYMDLMVIEDNGPLVNDIILWCNERGVSWSLASEFIASLKTVRSAPPNPPATITNNGTYGKW